MKTVTFLSFNLFLLFVPFSITISQSFGVISILTFIINSIFQKSFKQNFYHKEFLLAFFLYLSLPLAMLFSLPYYKLDSISHTFLRSEFSDIWMCFIIPVAIYHAKHQKYLPTIKKVFIISFVLVVITGFISIFTYFRLALYVNYGFQFLPGHRPQHFAGQVFGINTYLPIGFMNTHLTFGGLLSLYLPGIAYFSFLQFQQKRYFSVLVLMIFLGLAGLVFFYNQSRSAWIGVIFCIILLVFKNRSYFLSLFKKRSALLFFVILLFSIGVLGNQLIHKNWLLQRAVEDVLKDNTTENQRYFIYKNTLSLLKKHFLMGVGPGRFGEVHNQESNLMVQKNEQLWYELFITPRGHAHHDVLHFFAIGGFINLAILLTFYYRLINFLLQTPINSLNSLFIGYIVLYISGFFQCYMLDDEVVLPFYAIVGLFFGSSRFSVVSNRQHKIWSYVFLFIPLILSILYIFYKTAKEPFTVYQRKIKTDYKEDIPVIRKSILSLDTKEILNLRTSHAVSGLQIEGCLTHRFGFPIQKRVTDYSLSLFIPHNSPNPPKNVTIEVLDRDAFDQDKEYRAHEQRLLKTFTFPLVEGKNVLHFPGILSSLESSRFPENIKFRDFKFYFQGFDPNTDYFQIPYISFGKLCDTK
ncbi:MAG: O-antigen ligase family protein [Leptospiraceae bacterium]|nr:O-antigen ligase family protein [Leptospiraceae bacterium]MCP5496130.1 O-antigen ligase family protein [Leptospiraceae bacterium]